MTSLSRETGNKFQEPFVCSCMSQEAVIALPAPPKTATATWVGLFLSLFSMLIIRQVSSVIVPNPGPNIVFAKELLIWLSAGTLLWLVRKKEGLPLTSIGIGTSPWGKTLGWG